MHAYQLPTYTYFLHSVSISPYYFGLSVVDLGYTDDKNILYGSTYTTLFVPPVSYFCLGYGDTNS